MPNGTPTSKLKPSASTVVGATLGLPLGIVVVWLIKTYVIPAGTELPVEVASSIGSIVAQIVGMFFMGGRVVDTE